MSRNRAKTATLHQSRRSRILQLAMYMALSIGGIMLMSGCATGPQYEPAGNGETGYTDQRLSEDRWRVAFRGDYQTDPETVQNFLLYRAAEVTLEQGADYFVVQDRQLESQARYRGYTTPRFGFAHHHSYFYPGYFPGYHSYYYGPYDGAYFGDFDAREYKRYRAFAEITLHEGTPPEGDPDAYDANAVKRSLAGVVEPLRREAAGSE